MSTPAGPTPHQDVNDAVAELLAGAREVLADSLVGMYLYGSLASGDFDPATSDVDFLFVTDGELPDGTVQGLAAMHERFAKGDSPWARDVEGSYIPRAALRRHDPADSNHPTVYRGGGDGAKRLAVRPHGWDWVIQRHILRERGVVVTGPSPRDLIDPVSVADLRAAVARLIGEWWAPLLADPAELQHDVNHAYVVLTLCRMLYTLHWGEVTSKPRAARWLRAAQDGRWAELIDAALAQQMTWEMRAGTLELVRDALAQTR